MRYISNSGQVLEEMLATLGISSLDELFAQIPDSIKEKAPLGINASLSEPELIKKFEAISNKNLGANLNSFMGGGSYLHYSPTAVDWLLRRAEFFTSYTPYQPELSQGTLQCIFEFQTFISELTGMDLSNASMYDGASALAEAVLMASRINKKRKRILISNAIHPNYLEVVKSYVKHINLTVEIIDFSDNGKSNQEALKSKIGDDVICAVIGQPNFFGIIEDLESFTTICKEHKVISVVSVNEAQSLAFLKAPGKFGVDIVAGEAQSFGIAPSYGGPNIGFIATIKKYMRQIPGRIAGETTDTKDRRGFVLTLAAREQHIRRSKATSNICTNQNLMMLAVTIYLTMLGKNGLKQITSQSYSKTNYLKGKISELNGFNLKFDQPVYNEFVFQCPTDAKIVLEHCQNNGILSGIDLGQFFESLKDCVLCFVSEMQSKTDLDNLVSTLKSFK